MAEAFRSGLDNVPPIQVESALSLGMSTVSYTHLDVYKRQYVISDEELIKIFDVMKEWFREK